MGALRMYAVVAFISLAAFSTEVEAVQDQIMGTTIPPIANNTWTETHGNGSILSSAPGVLLEIDNNSTLTTTDIPSNLTWNEAPRQTENSRNGSSTIWKFISGGNGSRLSLGNENAVIPGINNSKGAMSSYPQNPVESAEDREMRLLVDETLSLIAEGEAQIPFDPSQRDLVLLVGNTGAGKTTIAKFLTEVENLEVYDAGDRALIRDIINNGTAQQHKISVNSTIISKTIFPDRLIDEETGTVFYDMPGFSDTRNASVEIANAWFMKMVADHARRVKIIFVVNYFALRTGETRTDFKQLLEHAIDYVRVPGKFRNGMGLIATKVESQRPAKKIIDGISFFLRQTSSSLAQVFPNELKRNKTAEIVEALLERPDKISFFRQPEPEDIGPVIDMEGIMSQRPHMQELIQNGTEFVGKEREDFGMSLSHKALLVVLRIQELTYTEVTDTMTSISKKIAGQFKSLVAESEPATLGVIINIQKKIALFTEELQRVKSRSEYFQTLSTLGSKLSALSNLDIHEDLISIKKHERSLSFCEDVNSKTLNPRVVEWTSPMERLVRDTLELVTDVSMGVSRLIEQATFLIAKSRMDALLQKVRTSTNKPQLLDEFEQFRFHVALIVESLKSARTFNEFAGRVRRIWSYRSSENSTVDFPTFVEDVVLEDESSKTPSPFRVLSWILPFDKVLSTMSRQMDHLRIDIEREVYITDQEELKRLVNETIMSYANKINEFQSQLIKAQADFDERIRLANEKWKAEIEESRISRAVLYEHSHNTGKSYTVALQGRDCITWYKNDAWNDRVTSISIQQGCVRIWEHSDCVGYSKCVCQNIPELHDHFIGGSTRWNDAMSSMSRCV